MPDPEDGAPQEGYRTITWDEIEESVKRAREEGALVTIGMGHGFFFQRLYHLRGYTSLLKDFIRKNPTNLPANRDGNRVYTGAC